VTRRRRSRFSDSLKKRLRTGKRRASALTVHAPEHVAQSAHPHA
jgi:hypothetical protein